MFKLNWKNLFKKDKINRVTPCPDPKCKKFKTSECDLFTETKIDTEDLLAGIQVKPDELERESKLIPKLDIKGIKWDKPVILIMDDEELVNFFIRQDLIFFQTIADKLGQGINYNSNEQALIDLADTNGLKDFLLSFKFDDYDLISVSTEYAAFAVRRNIQALKRVDFAILDISLGGSLSSVNGRNRESLNGIDIASDIAKLESKTSFMIYTGNDLGKYSPETLQFDKLLPEEDGLFTHLVNKDTSLIIRRVKLLSFLAGKSFNQLDFGK